MVGGLDKGLASSRWSPAATGRPPWSFTRKPTPARSAPSSALATSFSSSSPTQPDTPSSNSTDSATTPISSTTTTPATSTTTNPAAANTTTLSPSVSKDKKSRTDTDAPSDRYDQIGSLAAALNRIPTPWAELGRFTKIARRLKWKLPFLGAGYHAATTSLVLNRHDEAEAQQQQARRAEAELMFKLDFFEYYMLLERALVHLMGVFGIRITGAGAGAGLPLHNSTNQNNNNGAKNGGSGIVGASAVVGKDGLSSDHRFHANVLEALDDVRNPLYLTLGQEDVRYALARAKELRNRWKNADDPDTAAVLRNNARPLTDYDLERILETIFAGLEAAFHVAQQYVNEVRALAAARRNTMEGGDVLGDGGGGSSSSMGGGKDIDMDMVEEEEGEWEFMTDAMDWQAV